MGGSVVLDFSKAQPIPPAPAGQQGSATLDFSKAQPVTADDLTSNPNGEGTYRMVGRSGPAQIPYSHVATAQGQGFKFGASADQLRYANDHDADPNDKRGFIQKQKDDFDQTAAPAVDDSLGRFALKRTIGAILSPVVHPVDTAVGTFKLLKQGADSVEMSGSGGMDPEINARVAAGPATAIAQRTEDDYKQGGIVRAGTGLAADAFGAIVGGKALGAVGDAALAARSAMAPKVVTGQNYTAPHAAAFEGAIAPATSMGKNFIPQNVTPEALTPIRDTAARMAQGTPVEQGIVQAATDAGTKPLERLGAYQSIVQNALSDLESQHAPALAKAANVPVDTAAIVQQLKAKISPTMDAADVGAIRTLMMRASRAKTIGDLNTFRQELNVETAPEYRQSQIQAGRSGLSSQATSDLAGSVRSAYYDALEQATGQDFAPLKRQEASLMTTKEALQNQQAPLSQAEAKFATSSPYNRLSTMREKAGNVANIVKDPQTTVTQTILRESPATKVSELLRKSLDDLQPAPSSASPVGTPQQPGAPAQPALGPGQPPFIQGTPVPPPAPAAAPPSFNSLPPRLPASTAGNVPTPASPPPAFNEATAATRVQPNRFATRPGPTPSSGPIPVSPDGQAGVPASRYLEAGSDPSAAPAPPKVQLSRFAKAGSENLSAHVAANPLSGITLADITDLGKTAQGKGLLSKASSLKPGSAMMKALVQQIPAALGR